MSALLTRSGGERADYCGQDGNQKQQQKSIVEDRDGAREDGWRSRGGLVEEEDGRATSEGL